MMTIRTVQVAALAAKSSAPFVSAMLPHLRTRWPERFAKSSDEEIGEFVRSAIMRAFGFGFLSERHVNLFIEVELESTTRVEGAELPDAARKLLCDEAADADDRLFNALTLVRTR